MLKSKKKHAFGKRQVIGLVKRFVKEEAYEPVRDTVAFYKIYAEFPDEAFWRAYDLGFTLNSMFWFLSDEGRQKLKTDIALFHLDLSPAAQYQMEDAKVGEDAPIVRKKTTMADLLR